LIPDGNQCFKHLLWRQSYLLGDEFRFQVLGINFIFAEFIDNPQLIQLSSGVRFGSFLGHTWLSSRMNKLILTKAQVHLHKRIIAVRFG
jgi:hypothetical protein